MFFGINLRPFFQYETPERQRKTIAPTALSLGIFLHKTSNLGSVKSLSSSSISTKNLDKNGDSLACYAELPEYKPFFMGVIW
jgi:hypothetical protein